MASDPRQLHEAMMDWVFSDTGIAAKMEEFAHNYCAYFDYLEDRNDFPAAENKLVYTQIYQTFQGLFEGQLTAFLAQHGWTAERFLQTCQESLEQMSLEEDPVNWSSIYEIIVSLSDYEIFKIMMLDTRRKFPDVQTVAPQ